MQLFIEFHSPHSFTLLIFSTLVGEPFTEEEVEEMMAAAVDPEKKVVYYDDHVNLLLVEESN